MQHRKSMIHSKKTTTKKQRTTENLLEITKGKKEKGEKCAYINAEYFNCLKNSRLFVYRNIILQYFPKKYKKFSHRF